MRILKRRVARQRGGFSKSTEWRLAKSDPTFPKPVRISAGLSGYLEDEFDAWLAARPRVDEHERGGARRQRGA
jgi:predicted DNA-binding transcriptional regulator AlpA